MAIRNLYAAETWEKIYKAFDTVNFTAYDYDTIKESLLQYLRTYYKENFNDFIESSEFIAILEIFCYIAEQLAYRIDMASHENFITTAQRKQSILKLAKLISYKATRNIPARGLVKISSISTSEQIFDSQGNNLSNANIFWNDPNNPLWKEQFFLIMNHVLTGKFGQPQKSFQVGDVSMQTYTFNNSLDSFRNGVFQYNADTGLEQYTMEIVPIDIDEYGPFESTPDVNSQMSIVYATDGIGDGSDYTGFLMLTKQGTLVRIEYDFDEKIPNRTLELSPKNINEIDVWLNKVDIDGTILEKWENVETLNEQNLIFNTKRNRKKFETESLENDRIKLIFGDGDFAEIPFGTFHIWIRQSANSNVVIQKNKVVDQQMSFTYTSSIGTSESCSFTFDLTSTIQNSSPTETIDHIRNTAPATYYAQNRMVNGQDYNTYMLKDPSILRLRTVNRTFVGQPKYLDWNDATGQYQNIKLFGDDLTVQYEMVTGTQYTQVSSRSLIDEIIEPLLSTPGVINLITHVNQNNPETQFVSISPRRKFLEDYDFNVEYVPGDPPVTGFEGLGNALREKSLIQGVLDQHFYGEPLSIIQIGTDNVAVVESFANGTLPKEIYNGTILRSIDSINTYPANGTRPIAPQSLFGLRYVRTIPIVGNGSLVFTQFLSPDNYPSPILTPTNGALVETFTLEIAADNETILVTSSLRGKFLDGKIDIPYYNATTNPSAPFDFTLSQGSTPFRYGDSFVLDVTYNSTLLTYNITQRNYFNSTGRWELINGVDLLNGSANDPTYADSLVYDPEHPVASWIIRVEAVRAQPLNQIIGYNVYSRNLHLICQSPTTKFWYNEYQQIVDPQTKNVVTDKIRVLKSNIKNDGSPIGKNEDYDVVGPVKDESGITDFSKLEILPSNILVPDEELDDQTPSYMQFENFARNAYRYFDNIGNELFIESADYTSNPQEITFIGVVGTFYFYQGGFADNTNQYYRRTVSYNGKSSEGLDFMWQHFSPYDNVIDPSTSNIHDAFVLTSGYYNSINEYITGKTFVKPVPPTPLQLRTDYAYLLENKMLSDTVVMHPGKIKLLFGSLAEPQLRAKFRVVKSPTATFTNERVKSEILGVINDYFSIDNWDFGDTFFATELIGLIHSKLSLEISSVVIVPLYSTNSFGSLFVIESGIDEIPQSCANLEDIDIIDALTPTTMRQKV